MLVHQQYCLPGYFTRLWTFTVMILFALAPEPACSLKITPDNAYYYGARDGSVSLKCEFTLDSEDWKILDIEWNIASPIRQEDDKPILWYSQSIIHNNNLYAPLKNRIYFTSPEPQDGDASLSITDLKITDSGMYLCKIKTLASEQYKYIFLSVMERPDKPVCHVDSEVVLDTNIRLRCRSSQGTPPLIYKWAKLSRNGMVSPDAFVDAPGGDLYLDKITERDSGTYRCTVENLEGMEQCELILKIPPPSTVIDKQGPTPGTTAEITAGVDMEYRESILNITPPSTVTYEHGPTPGTTGKSTAGVDMEYREPILNITPPSTVIDEHGSIAGNTAVITAGAIVAVIVLITVMLTIHCCRKRHERLRRNAHLWALRNSCINRPIRIEQLRCEEEDTPYDRMETTDPVLSSSAEDKEKNASIEDGLAAFVEAKDLCPSRIEKSEGNVSMGNRDEVKEPCSFHTDNEKVASHEEVTGAM